MNYVNYLERSVAIATLLRKVSSLRAFVDFLQVSKTVEHDPMNALRLSRTAEPELRRLTDNQRARFESVFQNPWIDKTTKCKRSKEIEENVFRDVRNHLIKDKAIAFLSMHAGSRVEELFHLNIADIELREKSGAQHIRKGKGFKALRTSVPLPARKALQARLELYRDLGAGYRKDSPLFIRLRGKLGARLSIRAIQSMITEADKRARIEEPVSHHILRHISAFMLRQAGADIETRAKNAWTLYRNSIEIWRAWRKRN